MAAGVVLAVGFGAVELRRRFPLLDVRLFGRADFTTGAVGVTTFFLANFGFFFIAMQYVQLLLGYSALTTAFALTPLIIPVLLLSVAAPWLLPRLGLRVSVAAGLGLIAAGLFHARTLEIDSAYPDLAVPLLIMATGIGLCTAPTTSAIMGAVPDEKQGVASAVNDTTREVGAALGIALAGSVLAAEYGRRLRPQLEALPEPVRAAASNSLAEALEVARRLGPQGPAVAESAQRAFLESMRVSLAVLAAVCAAAAAFVAVWAPGRDGRQFRCLQRRFGSGSGDELGGPVGGRHDGGVRAAAGQGGKNRAVDDP